MLPSQRAPRIFIGAGTRYLDLQANTRLLSGVFVLAIVALISGCGGGSNSTPPPNPNPVPSITSLSPPSVVVSSTSQPLTINGTGFLSSSSVSFNGVVHTPTFVNSHKLTVVLSQSDLASVGTFPVAVTNPTPGGGTSANAEFQVAAAALTVNIIDLPAGAVANVVVSGPNGLSVNLGSSQVIDGAAGAYTVTASSVPYSSSKYFATTNTQTVVLGTGNTSTVTVDYYTVVPNTTKVLDQVGMESMTISPDGTTITLSNASAVAQSLNSGDVLASAPTNSAPNGLLVKITNVSPNGSTIALTVASATLEDAIQQANVSISQVLSPANEQAAALEKNGIRVSHSKRRSEAVLTDAVDYAA